jgi:uncharacterized protein (DUF1015 family)
MPLLAPFRALRPPAALAPSIACPPYDVVSSAEARMLARGKPESFFRISRPEVDLAPEVDEHADLVHARGRDNLAEFRRRGWLVLDESPCFSLYRQRMGSHVQTGLVACASVDAYLRGDIKRHELTRPDKEDDRTRHIDALGANDEPVFLAYRARVDLDRQLARLAERPPDIDFTTDEGVEHTVWRLPSTENVALESLLAELETLYIADGHHRSAAAARVQALRRARGAGAGEADWFLAVVFPHDQLQILPYNRLVKDLGPGGGAGLLDGLRRRFELAPASSPEPEGPHRFGLYLDGRWWRLAARPEVIPSDPQGALDVSILQNEILGPLCGIHDPRRDARCEFVGGIRGAAELQARVDRGEAKAAFALWPTSMGELLDISDAGQIMPPKSTWFEPKLRSGLFLHPF